MPVLQLNQPPDSGNPPVGSDTAGLTVDGVLLTGERALWSTFLRGADLLQGSSLADTLSGYLGNDTLNGNAGNGVLAGRGRPFRTLEQLGEAWSCSSADRLLKYDVDLAGSASPVTVPFVKS